MASRSSGTAVPPSKKGGAARKRFPKTERTGPAQKRALRAEKVERADAVKQRQERIEIRADEALKELEKFAEAARRVKKGDDWQNVLTGLGVANRDWRTFTTLESDELLTRQQLDDIYTQDSLAAKIIDELPEDSIRRWIKITSDEGQEATDFQEEVFEQFTRLKVKQRFLQWMRLGRKDGGCIMLIGADDGQLMSEPLEAKRIREIRHVHNLERWAIIPDVIDLDPLSANFGEPLYYLMLPRAVQSSTFVAPSPRILREQNTLDGLRIHYSRVFAHEGVQISERRKIAQRGWGYSVVQRAWNSIENYRVLWAHIATIFKHVTQTIIKFAGYSDLVGGDFEKAINQRLAQIQLARSTLNVVPMDKDDDLEEQTLSGMQGALEVFKYAQEDLAQAADMPLTQLFGHMPPGFSNDDDAGERNWNKKVRAAQEDYLLQPLTKLIELIAIAYGIELPDKWQVEFLPLSEPTDQETAETNLKKAQERDLYIKDGVLDPLEVRETLRADPKNEFKIEDGPADGDLIENPPPLPDDLPPNPVKSGPPAAKPSPGDPSQHKQVRMGPKGQQVMP